jgi:hypothetical protein
MPEAIRWVKGKPPIPGKEPFPPGNTLHLIHGLYSDRVRGVIEEQFAVAIRQAMSENLGRAYHAELDEHAVRRAARALAIIEIAETQIDKEGVESLSERAFRDYREANGRADRWLERLGMTPSARAKLGVNVAKTTDLLEALEMRRRLRDRLCGRCGAKARYRGKRSQELLCEDCAEEVGWR